MVHAVTPLLDQPSDRAAWASRVLDTTARAWQLVPRSQHALARRAPHGYVPRRARRRAVALAAWQPTGPALLAHSW